MYVQGPLFASAKAAAEAGAVHGFLGPVWRANVRKYYFFIDLTKKMLVAVLTGAVLVDPVRQAVILIVATSGQALFVMLLAPIKDPLFQVLEAFSCCIDAATFACGLALLYDGPYIEAVGYFMLAINVLSIVVQLAGVSMQSFGTLTAGLTWLWRRCCGRRHSAGAPVLPLDEEGADNSFERPPHFPPASVEDSASVQKWDTPSRRPRGDSNPVTPRGITIETTVERVRPFDAHNASGAHSGTHSGTHRRRAAWQQHADDAGPVERPRGQPGVRP